jgi:hypothetical protein
MRKFGTTLALVLAIALAAAGGCARKSGEPVMFTGKTLAQADVIAAAGGLSSPTFCGKLQYAEVNSAWLAWAYDDFRAELSAGQFGVVKWDDRAECTFFASSFEVFCQKRYFAQAFHSAIPAPGIAVGTMWFVPGTGQGHAINLVLTETGRRFFEPQTGKFLDLTPAQIASAYYRKFD